MTTKITARFVIGYDAETKDHVIYKDGIVVYENDVIQYVGRENGCKADKVIDGGNAVVSPGFIDLDALGDIDHQLFFTMAADKNSLSWSGAYFEAGPKEAMTQEEEAFKSYYAYSHLIQNGITTAMPITSVFYKKAGETYEEMAAAAKHAGELGLRAYLGPSYISAMNTFEGDGVSSRIRFMEAEGKAGLDRAIRFVKDFDGAYDGLISGVMVPERVELQTEAILKATKAAANEMNCLVRLHAAQGLFEYDTIRQQHGMSTIAYLDSIGFLDEKTLIPHVIVASGYSLLDDKSDDDLDILKKRQTSVIHCPLVYSRTGTALESFGRYWRKGLKLCMGTDTFPPDIFMNIRMGSALARRMDDNRPENSFANFYRAATIGGAEALGRWDLGRLYPGAKADMIIISLDRYSLGLSDDPLNTLCLSGFGLDVKTSVINGRTVMMDRQIPGLDEKKTKEKAQAYYDKMKASYLNRSCKKYDSVDDLFLSSFPVV